MSTDEVLEEDGYNVVPDDEVEYTGPGEQTIQKPSKEEKKVAQWLKKNIKTKKTKFLSHNVEYFTANKAIDALMKSSFVQGENALFTNREQAVEFLDMMLEHKFFHRAKKVPISIEDLRVGKQLKKEEKNQEITKEKTTNKKEKDKDDKKDTEAEAEAEASGNNGVSDEAGGTSASGEKKEKKKRKIRLDMHPEQVFVDGSEAYVWIYDPIPMHYWLYGLALLLGAVGICLFPLWPSTLRLGVYNFSLLAAGFLVFILVLTVVRFIIFTIVWAITGGNLDFWIFPNLTADVGFFASFWPLYEAKYSEEEKSKKSKSNAKKKAKDSDVEDNDDEAGNVVPLEPEKIEEVKEHDADMELRLRNTAKGYTEDESHSGSSSANEAPQDSAVKCSQNHSESESDGKDYEIISSSEVQNIN